MSTALAIGGTGLVTAVGLSAPASCAAIRASVTNPTETRFLDSAGTWIQAHQVPLGAVQWRGVTRLAKMAAMAIEEALLGVPRSDWERIPLLLCVAEEERPERTAQLDTRLFAALQQELDVEFAAGSAVIARGRVSAGLALAAARSLLYERDHPVVVVAGADSLISWPTLSHYERAGRLLTSTNSNGFLPGEGAGALLVTRPTAGSALRCSGIGFGHESAHIESEQPLRGEGLTAAIKAALKDSGLQMHELDYRVTDISGEQFYFKEAALALARILRQRKEEFDLVHPAEAIGETGAVAGIAAIALIEAACRKGYSKGSRILVHMANDDGARVAMTLQSLGNS